MAQLLDREIVWSVDPRTLSSHRGYVVSSLATPRVRGDGYVSAVAYGSTLFDAPEIQRLLEDLVVRLATRRGLFDLVRFANPWRAPDEKWRQARKIDDLLGDDEFAEHVHDLLIQYDRQRGRDPLPVDLLGQPSPGLQAAVFSALEDLESGYAPLWARMGLECWPPQLRVPAGFSEASVYPPRPNADVLVYCNRLYDINRAAEILPEQYVRTFADEIVRRAVTRGTDIEDMLDENRQPSPFMRCAAAEALARGLMKLPDAIAFIKRRLADRQSRFAAVAQQVAERVEPGILFEVRKALCSLTGCDRELSQTEIDEIELQAKIHPDDPVTIARIIHTLWGNVPTRGTELVRIGPLSLMRKEIPA